MLRVRRRVHLRTWKGIAYISGWPRRRGGTQSQLQQAWVDAFSDRARTLKSVNPLLFQTAENLAKGTGWYYRDVLERQAYGKLLIEEGQRKVTTPTARGGNTTSVALTSGVAKALDLATMLWDNNAFWDAGTPSRLTMKAAGLYLVGMDTEWTTIANSSIAQNYLRVNGTTIIANQDTPTTSTRNRRFNVVGLYYFEPDDYVEAVVLISASGNQARVNDLWCVGITPEVIF